MTACITLWLWKCITWIKRVVWKGHEVKCFGRFYSWICTVYACAWLSSQVIYWHYIMRAAETQTTTRRSWNIKKASSRERYFVLNRVEVMKKVMGYVHPEISSLSSILFGQVFFKLDHFCTQLKRYLSTSIHIRYMYAGVTCNSMNSGGAEDFWEVKNCFLRLILQLRLWEGTSFPFALFRGHKMKPSNFRTNWMNGQIQQTSCWAELVAI